MVKVVFCIAVLCLVYIYIGYPFFLLVVAKLWPQPWAKGNIFPSVSIIIAAYNEVSVISERIHNCLALNYLPDQFEVIISSDGSTDGTDQAVGQYSDRRVKLHVCQQRGGKLSALNQAIPHAKGESLFLRTQIPNFIPMH